MLAFPSLCLTLAFTIAVLALTRPPCHRFRHSPPKVVLRSTAHANVAEARWLRGRKAPRSGQCGLWCRPRASRLRMLGRWRRQYTWGSCTRATRGHSRRPVPQIRSPNAFTNRQLLFVKHWCHQQRVLCGLAGGFTAACAKMLACRRRLHGSTTAKDGPDVRLRQSTVLVRTRHSGVTRVSQRCRASW
jgi:hypothetical protein